ncbi:MAG: hypothetical protein ACYTJ0_18990 [Planctomycetota bacterium]|jgi:hypothetical protein
MRESRACRIAWIVIIAAAAVGSDLEAAPPGPGANVLASRLGLEPTGDGDDIAYWGSFLPEGGAAGDRLHAFSLGTRLCNIGAVAAQFEATHVGPGAGRHPVIAQQLYRLVDGRLEQVGLGWAAHLFCALNEAGCGDCDPTACSTLGAGCGSSEVSTIVAAPPALGPRTQIDPWPAHGSPTHAAQHPAPSTEGQNGFVAGRLRVRQDVIEAGGRFFAEQVVVTHDEAPEDRLDNASWREVVVTPDGMAGAQPGAASVHVGQPAIFAWKDAHPELVLTPVDVPGDGRLYLASLARDRGDGTWAYEYAIYNLNCRRGVGAASVPVGTAVTVLSTGFHDVDYHSGDGVGGLTQGGTDWAERRCRRAVAWSTDPPATDANANALRWGTMYNFSFIADAAPGSGTVNIGLWAAGDPGDPAAVLAAAVVPAGAGPSCPADTDDSGAVDVDDLVNVIFDWQTDGCGHGGEVDGSGTVDVDDLVQVILSWGACGEG